MALEPTKCSYDACARFAKEKNLCLTHHRWMLQYLSNAYMKDHAAPTVLDPKIQRMNPNRKCKADQCWSYARTGGYCTMHGGGRKCKVRNCHTASQTGGYCRTHGGGSKCREPRCADFARLRGLCLQHNLEAERAGRLPPAPELAQTA
ncbi:hypothetical protein SDRG_11291 [Saprolegnia diclina VS20]|uniref:Uncharacterized protein n=1 Tax=Saprolegnia diclina (strain VS20) TaxID=1156394 RepID=T0Q8X8_SAPDV|nr:hypothetical protein SDRG_11291 [Saprolegnia diclina VS20]EQC31106.1 hypothetical protein SDRG_11291 [Saprolegnia diclina VS20]|eukprot:XP_008615545.1 hypothetical protein SDRG_11291 [Saprolegnia diclina VS20]